MLWVGGLVLFGCSPAARVSRIYAKHPDVKPQSTVVYDTIRLDTIIYRDTTISITLKSDTVYTEGDIVYLPGDSEIIRVTPKVLILESQMAKARSWINYNKMYLTLMDKDTTLYFRLDSALKEAKHWERVSKDTNTVVETHFKTNWKRIVNWVGTIIVLILFVLFGFKIASFFKK